MRITKQVLSVAAAVGVVAAGGAAFTAGNTVPSTNVGQGVSQAVSGYTVNNVAYTLDTDTNGSKILSVSFDTTPDGANGKAARQAKVRLVTGDVYSACGAPTVAALVSSFSCTLQVPIEASTVNILDVVAASTDA